jgi:hypothetical protein
MDAADQAFIHPVKLIEFTFSYMQEKDCLRMFGTIYPPIQFLYSRYNLQMACKKMQDEKEVGSRMSKMLNSVMKSQYLVDRAIASAIPSMLKTGSLSEEWADTVLYLGDKHSNHAEVKKVHKMSGNINFDELDYLGDSLMKG